MGLMGDNRWSPYGWHRCTECGEGFPPYFHHECVEKKQKREIENTADKAAKGDVDWHTLLDLPRE
jgi:hypothetical protein